HRGHRGAQPGLGVARAEGARPEGDLRVHGPGPSGLPRPARPACRRLARGRDRPPRRRAEPAGVRAARDLPRRRSGPAGVVRLGRRGERRARRGQARRGGGRLARRARLRDGRRRGARAPRGARPRVGGRLRPGRDQDVPPAARPRLRGRRDEPARVVAAVGARLLDGDAWQLRACLGDEWRWHAAPEKSWDAPGWLPARVPGSVLDDLVRAGEAPSPYHERDSRLSEWVPERTWLYRRRLTVDPAAPTLRFDGVDHACTVLVDGRELASHEGMFVPFDVDVSGFADGAEHLLAVA